MGGLGSGLAMYELRKVDEVGLQDGTPGGTVAGEAVWIEGGVGGVSRSNYIFYLVTKEKTYEFDTCYARDGFMDRSNIKKAACYYKDKQTGEFTFQYCIFDEQYKSPAERQQAFDEYFKDIKAWLQGRVSVVGGGRNE